MTVLSAEALLEIRGLRTWFPVRTGVLVSADLAQHTARLQELADLGFDAIYLHHVGQELARFIDAFGEHVLPELQ